MQTIHFFSSGNSHHFSKANSKHDSTDTSYPKFENSKLRIKFDLSNPLISKNCENPLNRLEENSLADSKNRSLFKNFIKKMRKERIFDRQEDKIFQQK